MSEWEQCLDAIQSDGGLKNLADDFWGPNRLGSFTDGATVTVSERYSCRRRLERATYLSVVSAADMVGGEEDHGAPQRRGITFYLSLGSEIRVVRALTSLD